MSSINWEYAFEPLCIVGSDTKEWRHKEDSMGFRKGNKRELRGLVTSSLAYIQRNEKILDGLLVTLCSLQR